MDNREEERIVTEVPVNFAEDDKIFQGMFYLRNTLEAVALVIFWIFMFSSLPLSLKMRFYIVIPMGVITVAIACLGIENESVGTYLFYAIKHMVSPNLISVPNAHERQMREKKLLKEKQKKRKAELRTERLTSNRRKKKVDTIDG